MGDFDPRATTQAERRRDEVTRSALLFWDSMHTTPLPATADRSFSRCHVTR